MPRWLLPALLALVTAASSALALQQPAAPRSRLAGLPTPKAAVLSPRRVPDLLTRTIADQKLATALDAALADTALGPAREASCLVVRADQRVVYARNPDRPLIPASNLKILTALAAVAKLGPDDAFVTAAKAAPSARIGPDGTLNGTLHLVGAGDPLIATADYIATFRNQPQIYTPFERLADQLVDAGLRHIAGGVMGDESRYDTQRYIPTWKPRYITDSEVGPASALLVNDGFTQFKPKRVAAASPPAHAAALLAELLKSRGVLIDGPTGESVVPAGAATISELRSPPVREVVAEMLKESDNTTAELLVKELGRRQGGGGTTAAGLKAMRDVLAEADLPVAQLANVDGSGLDRSDRATCGLLIAALATGDSRTGPVQAGLPTAAKDGTLALRFRSHPAAGRLRAKTGSLDGVVGLTGFMDPPANTNAAPLAFSLLANELPQDALGRNLQETVGAILARYPEAPAPADLAP